MEKDDTKSTTRTIKKKNRSHQYKLVRFAEAEKAFCRACKVPFIRALRADGYLCSVCWMVEYALCSMCYYEGFTWLLLGCDGDGTEPNEDSDEEEEEEARLEQLKLGENDLAVESRPKSYVPSVKAIQDYAIVTEGWIWSQREISKLNKKPISYWLGGENELKKEEEEASVTQVKPPEKEASCSSEFPSDETLLLHIFSRLLPRDLCRAACVSSVWNRVAMDNSLWKELSLKRWPTLNPNIRFKKWVGFYRARHKSVAQLEEQYSSDSYRPSTSYPSSRSAHVIDNCRWIFKCPLTWESLSERKGGPECVRHCDACGENVQYCNSIEEVEMHAKLGNCISIGGIGFPSGVTGRPASIYT